jgi:hypothetical protein
MDFESKNRIRKRRYDLLRQEIDKSNYSSKNKSKTLSFLSSLCILCSIALGVLIYGKNDVNGKWIKENFGIEVSFSKVNSYISKYTNYILDFDIFDFLNKDQAVTYVPSYQCVGENTYQSYSNEITSIGEGTVVYVGESNGANIIIIQHDLGYTATYSGIEDILVHKYDRVEDKASIGISFEPIKIEFSKDNKEMTYEEVIELFS